MLFRSSTLVKGMAEAEVVVVALAACAWLAVAAIERALIRLAVRRPTLGRAERSACMVNDSVGERRKGGMEVMLLLARKSANAHRLGANAGCPRVAGAQSHEAIVPRPSSRSSLVYSRHTQICFTPWRSNGYTKKRCR